MLLSRKPQAALVEARKRENVKAQHASFNPLIHRCLARTLSSTPEPVNFQDLPLPPRRVGKKSAEEDRKERKRVEKKRERESHVRGGGRKGRRRFTVQTFFQGCDAGITDTLFEIKARAPGQRVVHVEPPTCVHLQTFWRHRERKKETPCYRLT